MTEASSLLSHVKVFRYEPETDHEPRYDEFTVPYEEGNTVMDLLNTIFETMDSTIAFRTGCAGAGYQRCGACAMAVNGKPVLACKVLAQKTVTIEPHPRFEVLRDLAVDFGRTKTVQEDASPQVAITVDPQKCDGCRDCVFICPMGVYELKKVGKKAVSVPVNIVDCCGESCNQCFIFCKNSAILVQDIREGETK